MQREKLHFIQREGSVGGRVIVKTVRGTVTGQRESSFNILYDRVFTDGSS